MGVGWLCAILAITALTHQAHSSDVCNKGCTGSSQVASFVAGHKYTYSLDGEVDISIAGADKQQTTAKLSAEVVVTGLGNCANVLRVKSVKITGPNGKAYGKPVGVEKPVRFTVQDGKIGSEICSEEGDNQRSLNIKRAIISLLSTAKQNSEISVFGACPIDSSVSKEGNAQIIHKNADLSRCAFREKGKHDLITSIYNPKAEIKSTHLLQSHLNVESKVVNGVPEKVSCSEDYVYNPFSAGPNGARARVVTRLTLTGQSAGTDTGAFKNTKSIIFENPHPDNTEHNNQANVLSALKSAAQSLQNHAGAKSAGIFAQLVKIFRSTSKDDLLSVFGQIKTGAAHKDNHLTKKVFLDALLRAGTGDSVEVSIKLLEAKELTPFEQKLVVLSLGSARHATSGAIAAAATLLDQPHISNEVYLGAGALAGVYCREHACHATSNPGVAALAQKLAAKIGNCKPHNKAEEDTVVAALKGVRNIRHIEKSLVKTLVHCVTDATVKARVKVAALEAFHADPCTAELKKTAIDTMKNRQLDSEIRIKAYLVLVECPCARAATEIKNLLDTEQSIQVGRYITSSLRFIRASANPDRELAKQHFAQIRSPKFPTDDRKYSHFREYSYNIDSLGLGAVSEESVIFSQDSFFPRSASFNVTTEIFGHSFNLFEIGVRQGNLDRVLEHFFGPKGYFAKNKPQDIYDDLVEKFEHVEGQVKDKARTKRAVQQEIANFAKRLKGESTGFNEELDLDVAVKIFGTDAIFLSLGDDKGFNFDALVDKIFKELSSGVDKLKHFSHDFRSHVLFLDAELAYPTALGLPLKLNVVGSATTRVTVDGGLDLRKIYKNIYDTKVDFKLVPSTNVELAGTFAIDADQVSTGLRIVSSMHSSTGAHGVFKLLERGREGSTGNGFDLQFGLPIDKQEVLSFTRDFVFVTSEKGQQESEVPIKVQGENSDYHGCFDQLSNTIGLTLCGDFTVPFKIQGNNPAALQPLLGKFPLIGSTKLAAFLEKNDLKNYHILVLTGKEGKGFEFLFEVEGVKTKRMSAIHVDYVNSNTEHIFKASLESPIKTASAELGVLTKPSEMTGFVNVKHDADEYYGRVGFSVAGNEQKRVYTPLIEFKMPGSEKKSLQVDGKIVSETVNSGKKYTFNGIKVNMPDTNEKVEVDGFVVTEKKNFNGELKAVKGDQKMTIIAALDDPNLKVEFQNTLNPHINFKLNAMSTSDKDGCQNDINLIYGPDLNSKTQKISYAQKFKYHYESTFNFDIITKNHITAPGLEFEWKADAEFDPKKINIDFEIEHQKRKAELELEARTEIKKPGDYLVKFEVGIDDKGIAFFSKRDIVSQDKSNFENVLTIKKGDKYELSGVVNHKFKPKDVNVGAVGHFKITSKNEDIKFDFGTVDNPTLFSSHSKVSSGSGEELVNFLITFHKGANANGQLNLNLKETVTANGNFKVNEADGNGNGVINVDFKKLGRKMKAEIRTSHKDSQYNANADIFLDFEKDNNNKIHLSTNTIAKHGHVDTKNEIVIGGKKTLLTGKADYSGEKLNRKQSNLLELTLPNERVFTFKRNVVVSDKDHVYNGNFEYSLSDAAKRGATPSTVSFKGKLADMKRDNTELYFEYDSIISVQLDNGKNLAYSLDVKHKPDAAGSSCHYKNVINGNIIPKPAALSGTIFYQKDPASGLVKGIKHQTKGNYGSDISFLAEGNEEVDNSKTEGLKYKYDYSLQLNLPFEKAHDIKLNGNALIVHPKNKEVIFEYTIGGGAQVNADSYKLETSGKIGTTSGFEKIKIVVPHQEPFTFDTSYKAALEGDKKSAGVEVKSTYGKGKSATVAVEVARVSHSEYSVQVHAAAPHAERLKKLDINLVNKRTDDHSLSSHLTVEADSKVYKTDVSASYSRSSPLLDISYTCPVSGKPSRIYFKGSNVNDHGGKFDFKIVNVRDFDLDGSTDIHTAQDFIKIKLNLDSPKLKLDKYHHEITSKDTEHGKRLEFHSTNAGKNVISGSTSYVSKKEGSKNIVEGSGTLKVKDEEKSASFKYIRDVLTEGPEQGIEEFFNLAVGERSVVVEARVTNLEYKFSQVYCEEKKQCANTEFNSKLNIATPGLLQHTVNIGVDLRKLGLSPEFGLQMSSEASDSKLPQYLLDLHLNQDQNKYHLHAYSQPKNGAFPAGIVFTLPSRVIAFESTLSYPEGQALPFPIKGEAAFFLNKNHQPKLKAGFRMLADVTGKDKERRGVLEFGFSHPALDKEAVAKFEGSIASPEPYAIKTETTATFSCPVLGERKSSAYFEANPKAFKLMIRSPLVVVISAEGRAETSEKSTNLDLTLVLLQGKPVAVHFTSTPLQSFEFTTGYKNEGGKLSISGHLEPEKKAEFSTDLILGSDKKNMFRVGLFLDNNLVKPIFSTSKENIEYFGRAFFKDLENLIDRLKELANKRREEGQKEFEKLRATYEKILGSYKSEMDKLKHELISDQSLQQIGKTFNSIIHMFAEIADSIVSHVTPLIETVVKDIKLIYEKIDNMWKTKIEPELHKLFENFKEFARVLFNNLVDVVAHFAALVQSLFDKFKPEFQEITKIIGEIFKDITRIIVSNVKEMRALLTQQFNELVERIRNLPVFDMLREKMSEFRVPDQIIEGLKSLKAVVEDVIPTQEGKNLVAAIFDYIEKKLSNVKVDDQAELKAISQKIGAAYTSLVAYIRSQAGHMKLPSFVNLHMLQFNPLRPGGYIPKLSNINFSVFNYFKNGDFPALTNFVHPSEFYPPLLRGTIVRGQHFFTFDNSHMTFPGSCRYVLATDRTDGNFTLAIQLNDGNPQAIVLSDKSGNVIEIKENGQVTLNGANHGYPVRKDDTLAFRTVDGRYGVGTLYGAMAFCSPKLTVCAIQVSGFYVGKLRGLLGDGNYEKFDDFRLPNGKIASNEAEFGNAYRLATSCAQVKTPEHHHKHTTTPECDKVFGATSPLWPAFPFQDREPYRQACSHATASASNKMEQACDIGRGFIAKLDYGGSPFRLPADCYKCHEGDTTVDVGKTSKHHAPTNKADVVVTVELTKGNEQPYKDLLVPVIGHIVDQLKQKKIDDVKVYLYGVTPEIPYAIPIDIENAKMKGGKPQFTEDSRYGSLGKTLKTSCPRVNEFLAQASRIATQLQIEFDLYNVKFGYTNLGTSIPYRPDALRAAVTLISETCIQPKLPFSSVLNSIRSHVYTDLMGFQTHLFTVTPVMKVGAGKQSSQIVGFDKHSVYLLGDKKRGKDTEQIRATLETYPDQCIEFAEKSGGSVFSVDTFKDMNPGQRKQYIQQAAHSIVDKLLKYELETECACVTTDAYSAKNVCVLKSKKEAARRR